MLRVKAAHRFVAVASRKRVEAAASRRPSGSVHGLILRSVVARYCGDIERSLALLHRAAGRATPAEMPFVLDLLAPIYVALENREALAETVNLSSDTGLHGAQASLRAILAAMEGDLFRSRQFRQIALDETRACDDRLTQARALQRLAVAAYRAGEPEEAAQYALRCAQLAELAGAHGLAASAYSVAYNVHQAVTGDVGLAFDFAQKMAASAALAGNESYEFLALVARYELSAEIADDALLKQCRSEMRRRALPTLYRERFASGLADVMQFAWSGDFAAFNAGVILLYDATAHTRSEKAVCLALRALAEVGAHEGSRARRSARAALALSSLREASGSVPYEVRYLRLAHALASAACVIQGDCARGRRILQTRIAAESPDFVSLVRSADGEPWQTAPQRMRGYCRVVFETRKAAMAAMPAAGLTPGEMRVLRLLADGMNAPEIARETARSVHTVRAHTRAIISKLGVRGRFAAISHARERGFLS